MLNNFTNEIKSLMKWHEKAKEAAIKAESLDPSNTSYIQPLHELRYGLDHFIRALTYEEQNSDEEKIKKAISSAIGHLQRSYSDSIEWILVSVRDEYYRIVGRYSPEQIRTAFPQYYDTIRPDIEKITNAVNDYKINKRGEEASDSEEISTETLEGLSSAANTFITMDALNKLEEYLHTLYAHEVSLI